MRLIHLALTALLLAVAPVSLSAAAGGATSVRAIAFVGSNAPGATDSRLAPYESVLRGNLPFQSFRYVGESSATVSPGGTASLSLPGGTRVQLEGDASGTVKVHRGGNVLVVAPGRPVVFMAGPPTGKGEASGVIVMTK